MKRRDFEGQQPTVVVRDRGDASLRGFTRRKLNRFLGALTTLARAHERHRAEAVHGEDARNLWTDAHGTLTERPRNGQGTTKERWQATLDSDSHTDSDAQRVRHREEVTDHDEAELGQEKFSQL